MSMTEQIGGKFLRRLKTMTLVACGVLAASAVYAEPESAANVATLSVPLDSARQCGEATEHQALAGFETGTTFLLTEKGLIAIKRPAAKKSRPVEASWAPDYNTGNS